MTSKKPNVSIYDIRLMDGPYVYTKDEVKSRVADIAQNGNYRTGHINKEGQFVPKYTGRGVVYDRLMAHLDEGCKDTHFKFIYVSDELESYHIESADYDFFGKQLRNAEHPKKPDGKDYLVCPYCGQ